MSEGEIERERESVRQTDVNTSKYRLLDIGGLAACSLAPGVKLDYAGQAGETRQREGVEREREKERKRDKRAC